MKEQDSPMERGDGGQMGGTSREGYLAAPGRAHFYDSDKNGHISSKDNLQAAHLIEYSNGKTEHLADEGVRAGDGDNEQVLTEEIIYDVRPTEG